MELDPVARIGLGQLAMDVEQGALSAVEPATKTIATDFDKLEFFGCSLSFVFSGFLYCILSSRDGAASNVACPLSERT